MSFFEEKKIQKQLKVAVCLPLNEPARDFIRMLGAAGHTPLEKELPAALAMLEQGEVDFLVNGAVDCYRFAALVDGWAKKKNPKATSGEVSVFERKDSERLVFITDSAVHLRPSLPEKVALLESAAKLAKACGVAQPNAAGVAAVEKVDPFQPATVEAAALAKMSQIGQLKGFTFDGPLALDLIMSSRAAEIKKVNSPVAGNSDILLAPDRETARLMEDALVYCGKAKVGRVILGGVRPVPFNPPADSAASRMNSLLLATLLV
ncbi:MAG TPA: phosphate acyltransferase [Chroococcales cyanobacterium]